MGRHLTSGAAVGPGARGYTCPVVPLSAVVITHNEEAMLPDALASVAFCDEIVVVDSGSSDRTRHIAVAAGARVILNEPWPGYAAQRNVAVDAARHDWVIALDADERVAAPLRVENKPSSSPRSGLPAPLPPWSNCWTPRRP